MATKMRLAVPLTADEVAQGGYGYDDLAAITKSYAHGDWARAAALETTYQLLAETTPVPAEIRVRIAAARIGDRIGKCPESYLHGSDANGHRFAKELYCGAEWCPVCGKKDSPAHLRRVSRWWPKAQQVRELGEMVIEFPLASRDKPRSKRKLEEYGKIAVWVLTGQAEVDSRRYPGPSIRDLALWHVAGRKKRHDGSQVLCKGVVAEIKARYFARGMRRWHFFGDVREELRQLHLAGVDMPEPESEAAIFQPTAKSNCHLNVLLDAGYIPKPKLRHIKSMLYQAFGEPVLDVYYGYAKTPGQIVHVLKYVTRATFKNYKWDEYLAGQLYGFRNMRSWGKWLSAEYLKKHPEAALWTQADIGEAKSEIEGVNIEAINSLGESKCYKCGLPIIWSKPRPIGELRSIADKVDLGAGYYELPSVAPCGHVPETDKMRWRRWYLNIKARLDYPAILAEARAKVEAAAKQEARQEAAYQSWVDARYCKPRESAPEAQ